MDVPQMPCPSLFSASPATDFTLLHDIMRSHIHRGNSFAVLTALSLSVVHEDPAFWRTCTYRDGIAAALINSFNMGNPEGTQLEHETGGTSGIASSRVNQEPLAAGELYMIIRRISGDDPLLCRVLDQLEENEPLLSNGNARGTSLSSSSAPNQIYLDELCAVLQGRCCSQGGERSSPHDTITVADIACGALKHFSDCDNSLNHRRILAEEAITVVRQSGCSGEDVEENDDSVSTDAIKVLTRISALPGSTRALASFDAVGDFLNDGETSQMNKENQEGEPCTFPNAGAMGGFTTTGSRRKQQRRYKFSPMEDEAILQGVARFARGPGRFESILYAYRGVWHPGRTATQLHDHWRGTLRNRAILQQGGYRGKESLALCGKKASTTQRAYTE